jgi:hypothetical protein
LSALAPTAQPQGQDQGQAQVPFLVGSSRYREAPFFSIVTTMGASQVSLTPTPQITPGNFLSGVVLQVTSASGVLGTTAALVGDGPWGVISSISITDTGGGEILYPMSLFSYVLAQKYLRPWLGDPSKRSVFSNSVNPAFTVRIGVEVRDTLAVLANTDARAQYRLNVTLAPLVGGLVSVSTGVTAPAVTVKGYIDAWAQPDAVDLAGRPITPLPPGLGVSRFLMHEVDTFLAGNNTIRFTLTGNEIRGLILIVRNSAGTRVDLTDANAGPLRFRLDNRVLWVMNPTQIVEEMETFYASWYDGFTTTQAAPGFTRETGVYVIPRFRNPGDMLGEFWLQTVEQSLLQIELSGADLGTNAPGTIEVIYDQLAVGGQLPGSLEGV